VGLTQRQVSAACRLRNPLTVCAVQTRPVQGLNRSIRQHWGIEKKLHWVLDVGFGEDLDRKRADHPVQNFSVLNLIALNLLKQDKSSKRGIRGKRLKAGWNNDYLLHLLRR
jgi:predicted transposase YbfD/YdcC